MLSRALALCILAWHIPAGVTQSEPKGSFFKPLFCDPSQLYPQTCQHNISITDSGTCLALGCCFLEHLCYKSRDGACGAPDPKSKCRTLLWKVITEKEPCLKAKCCFREAICIQPTVRKTMQRLRIIAVLGGLILLCSGVACFVVMTRRQLKAEEGTSEKKKKDEASAYLLELLEESEDDEGGARRKKKQAGECCRSLGREDKGLRGYLYSRRF
ncbi:uncharacterized protein LOC115080990 [Rhinatrema bivittatum]|uniref:uncharacterized protein LOC115080990 n=1 Tax=Rhinatrema bivittatum TaxID=194408 RepID=UPI001127E7A7|nr:uncharacterized protein LOC115080990 [Rhinatrema bivittatum]